MEDQDFEEMVDVLHYLIRKVDRLQEVYRKETGREYVGTGHREQPNIVTYSKVMSKYPV